MDRDEALGLLGGGVEGIEEWNRRREAGEVIPALNGARLDGARLAGAHLYGAYLYEARLDEAILAGAHLAGAHLYGARLDRAILEGARLDGAELYGARLEGAKLYGATLTGASCYGTSFADVDLSEVKGLDLVNHRGPSPISTSTLVRSWGKIPEAFLRGCGLTPWEVLSASLYDPDLTPARLKEIQGQVFDAWTKGRSMISGCFFSYSWKDKTFVDNLGTRLKSAGINTWRDKDDTVAGPLQPQVWQAIQDHQVVIIVLSENSVQSDWVENELDMARNKEKEEGRAVLCPVTLDDAWRAKVEAKDGPGDPNRQLWRTLEQKVVVKFPRRNTRAFDGAFGRLLKGLKLYYGPANPPAVS
jgi:uncharacterized protein YjbI with pentapeptide repeats